MSKSICRHCKHKDGCDETVRLYGLPNMRVTECKEYEPKDCDTKMTLTREETIERLKQNKAAAEYYAGQSRITAEIENALKDSEAFDMAIEALQQEPMAGGEWETVIRREHYPSGREYEADYCSVCGKRGSLEYNYCPCCGARMKGGAE